MRTDSIIKIDNSASKIKAAPPLQSTGVHRNHFRVPGNHALVPQRFNGVHHLSRIHGVKGNLVFILKFEDE
jgi:hypothetical protein